MDDIKLKTGKTIMPHGGVIGLSPTLKITEG